MQTYSNGNRYNRAAPRQASFVRLALYHVGAWRAPLKRRYGKARSYAAQCYALGYGHTAAQCYLATAYAAHKLGIAIAPPQPLRLTYAPPLLLTYRPQG